MNVNELCEQIKELYIENPNIRIYVEGNAIVLEQDFTDNVMVSLGGFDRQKQTFKHIITFDGNMFLTVDQILSNATQGLLSQAGLSSSFGVHQGQFFTKGSVVGLGKDNMTGEIGPVIQSWNSNDIKKPVREYLESLGMVHKRAGSVGSKTGKIILFVILGGLAVTFLTFGLMLLLVLR